MIDFENTRSTEENFCTGSPVLETDTDLEELQSDVERLKAQNEELSKHIFALEGRHEYATYSQLHEAFENWSSAIQDFCPRIFPMSRVDDLTQLHRVWEDERFRLLEKYGEEIFYNLTASLVFDIIKGHISKHFMVGVSELIGHDVDKGLEQLRNYMNKASDSKPSYRQSLTKWRCETARMLLPLLQADPIELAQSLTDLTLQKKLIDESMMLSKAVSRLTQNVQKDLERRRIHIGLKPLQGTKLKMLEGLIMSGTVLTINMMTSRKSYNFHSVSSDEQFDGDWMEAVGYSDSFGEILAEKPILFALTQALMEINEHGQVTDCVAKAKVFLESG